jgi:signal transduction histidine kinase/DNA-binding response OmpR family regulator/ligand-binding sensor domain-containing protein
MRSGKFILLVFFRTPKKIFLWLLFPIAISVNAQQFINPHFSHFTINNGLSQSLIYSIAQDSTGFMWFGTKDGLNRFDGYEFKIFHHDPFDSLSIADNAISALFTDSKGRLWIGTMNGSLDLYDSRKNRFSHYLKENIGRGNINAITEDPSGNIWAGIYGNGIFKLQFNKANHSNQPDTVLHYFNKPGDNTTLNNNLVIDVFADKQGGIWTSTIEGLFQYAKPNGTELRFSAPQEQILKVKKTFIPYGAKFDLSQAEPIPASTFKLGGARFLEDNEDRIWMAAPAGLFLLNQNEKKLFYFDPVMPGLIQGNVRSICKNTFRGNAAQANSVWMGFVSGAGVMDTKNFTLQLFLHDPGYSKSLLPGSILCIFKDHSGSIWFGTSGSGLSEFDTHATLFPMPEYHTADGNLRTEDLSVRSFLDTKKYLFIGTQSSLMMADKSTGLMSPVMLENNQLWSNLIFSMVDADTESCWIAANSGMFLYNYKKHSRDFFSTGIQSNGQVDNRIFKLYKDKQNNLWCLTPYSLSFFDTRRKTFKHYFFDHRPVNGFTEPTFGDIYQTPDGNFWLGTGDGLLYFDTTTKKFTRYITNTADPNSLSFTAVRCLLPDPKDPKKFLWVGTAGGGLNKLDLSTKKFKHFTEKDGLPNNVIYGILSGEKGNLWMSTNKGISMFDPATKVFVNYDINAGLQSNEFNSGAFYKNSEGQLFFGGINGFNAFTTRNIKGDNYFPQLAFTGFSLFNRPVSIGDKDSPLEYAITETKKIVLPYSDNIISFQVAALDFSDPERKQYAYKLEPSNTNWVQMGSSRLITFSNLEPGNYTLRVKAGSLNGQWNETGISLNLVILPPWWKTWWAYLLYFCIVVVLLYFLRRYELRRIHLRNRLKVERMESHKLKELDHLKSRFFANISHEFRTPLTLIMGPVEDLLKTGNAEEFKKILPEVHRNSVRLLQLINQLLDLSKLDAKRYRINTSREDIIPFAKQIVHSFYSMAERKNIALKFEVDGALEKKLQDGATKFYFDEDMIEKIITNLLSNAFKFTGDSGSIHVCMKTAEQQEDFLELSVKDTGIGIPPEKLAHIFDRFYQADDSDERRYEGSGVGLALLKELVELLQGEVSVKSETGKGTAFFCYLPFNKKIISDKAPAGFQSHIIEMPATSTGIPEHHDPPAESKSKDLILIVEDHADVRKYIKTKLEGNYIVAEAGNGAEGLEMARDHIPDLVVSDVMMPGMDGFELCKKLKTDNLTSHIPVILLTAKAEDTDRMTGLETGADAYLTKPFNAHELNIRIKNLIELRKKLRTKFSDKLVVKPSEITVTSMDREFMKKLLSVVEKHISDAKFSVTQLGSEMNMSVSQLNRKLKAIIDQSPQKFIRSIRMQRALEMLNNNTGNISEISWEVGFEDPGYFSRVFKMHFGYPPSEVKSE